MTKREILHILTDLVGDAGIHELDSLSFDTGSQWADFRNQCRALRDVAEYLPEEN